MSVRLSYGNPEPGASVAIDSGQTTQVALSSLRRGQEGVISASRLDADDAALLRAMGLCTSASVKVVRTGQPCVVAVGGVGEASCSCGGMCRIGLARGLAERIFVTVVA
jgi:Fe2+ transport system protein FeoA